MQLPVTSLLLLLFTETVDSVYGEVFAGINHMRCWKKNIVIVRSLQSWNEQKLRTTKVVRWNRFAHSSNLSPSISTLHINNFPLSDISVVASLTELEIQSTTTGTKHATSSCRLSPVYHQSYLIKIFSNHREWWAANLLVDGINWTLAREGNKNISSVLMDSWE